MVDETVVRYEQIRFSQGKGCVRATFLERYYFDIPSEVLEQIGPCKVVDGALVFSQRPKRVHNKFSKVLDEGFARLVHAGRGKPCLYIHKGSGIPLVGSNEFGIIDRGTNILEVKPLTGCNLSCSFCSVGEGVNDKTDVLVQEEYLVEEFGKLAKLKEHPVEANIGPQGEPLLYPRLVELVRDLKAAGAAVVSMNSNGTLLSERLIDDLAAAGLDRINLSVHATDQSRVQELMGGVQNLSRLQKMVRYCEGRIDVLLAPVLVPGVNDDQLDGLIIHAKSIRNRRWPSIGVQNFLVYPGGRNPGVVARDWEEFYNLLERKGKEHGVDLLLKGAEKDLFAIHKEGTLPKPFRKGQVVGVELAARGRRAGEWLGVAGERVVTVRKCPDGALGQRVKVRLLRDKHNIFTAVPC